MFLFIEDWRYGRKARKQREFEEELEEYFNSIQPLPLDEELRTFLREFRAKHGPKTPFEAGTIDFLRPER